MNNKNMLNLIDGYIRVGADITPTLIYKAYRKIILKLLQEMIQEKKCNYTDITVYIKALAKEKGLDKKVVDNITRNTLYSWTKRHLQEEIKKLEKGEELEEIKGMENISDANVFNKMESSNHVKEEKEEHEIKKEEDNIKPKKVFKNLVK